MRSSCESVARNSSFTGWRFRFLARGGKVGQEIAQFVLTIAAAHRAADQAEHGAQADGPIQQDDVSKPFQQAQRAKVDLGALGVGKQQDRDVGPRGLRPQAVHQLVDRRVFQRFFGEENGGRAAHELLAQNV